MPRPPRSPGIGIAAAVSCVFLAGSLGLLGAAAPQEPSRAGQSASGAAAREKNVRTVRPRPPAGRDRPGFYKGRRIADVMSWQGVDWLFRETRIQEEQPETMLDVLKIPPGATVADVGAGAGYHSIRLAKRVGPEGTVLATDVQPEMIQMLRQNVRAAGVENVRPLLCTQEDTMLPEGKVDLALMVDVYHESSDPEALLRGLRKALKPRGRLVLVEFRGEDPEVPIKPEHKMTVKQVRREVEPQGFVFKDSLEFLPWQHIIVFERPDDRDHSGFEVREDEQAIRLSGGALDAAIARRGYVSGVVAGSLLDRKTGSRDLGFGLDIVDWLMEPGSDEAYRARLPRELVYEFNNPYHGKIAKRSVEGPQICTQARELDPRVTFGKDFVAVVQDYTYHLAAPGKKAGSRWEQTLVFPRDTRYFVSSDRITTANASDALFLRVDMPGHIKHQGGDSFSEVYLSYHGRIPAREFLRDFAPDDKFRYVRRPDAVPKRMIRAYHIRDPKTGKEGPWLAGMTLDPGVVSEAWCHQRGYVCMIEEFGGRPIRPGQSFSAAFAVGFFDSVEEMEAVYDRYAGANLLTIDDNGWTLVQDPRRN
ncbi:MAG: class I SAM-dependent methyltransferase [Isosphaeraceae bacterium]